MRILLNVVMVIFLASCSKDADFKLSDFPDLEQQIYSTSSFTDIILEEQPSYVTDPIFEFQEDFRSGNMDNEGLEIRRKIKQEYGMVAWNQILDLNNKLVVPIIYSTHNKVELTAILYLNRNSDQDTYRLVGSNDIRQRKESKGLIGLYDLGYLSYFNCKVLINKDCEDIEIYEEARQRFISE